MFPWLAAPTPDWLIDASAYKAKVVQTVDRVVISNGLVERTFVLRPNLTTVSLRQMTLGQELVRAVKPEAELVFADGVVDLGGSVGQPNRAFLTESWIAGLQASPSSIGFVRASVGETKARMAWKRVRPSEGRPWPPPGVELRLAFKASNGQYAGLEADVCYEMYDGLPAYRKWVEVRNGTGRNLRLKKFSSELLGMVEAESVVDSQLTWRLPAVNIFTDYQFGGMALTNSNRTVNWEYDPNYTSQVNYELKTPCDLRVKPPTGPDIDIPANGSFATFNTFVLLQDTTERERQGLAVRRLYRTLAPWSTENPLMLHQTSTNPEIVKRAIDQAAECGFEMIILSFGSGLNMEDASPSNIAKFKELRAYANAKGIELGGYSLLASRRISDEDDVINPKTGKTGGAIFGNSPCLCSNWGNRYFDSLKKFISETGFNLLEHDGSYPGDVCASTNHPGHQGLDDSQWQQYQKIQSLYAWARGEGIFLNVPDHYFFAGSNKTGMGYREVNWSLPRAQQHIHARQNLFDGTWEKAPSMGWMMTPLVEYQGGGAAATIEPLREHIDDYERHLVNNLGYGAQSCYRGPRLYDSPEVKAMVIKWVNWFKEHRAILESDVVHLRRADARSWDGILHVNPRLDVKAMLVAYNPLDRAITEEIRVPLYYSGLTGSARASVMGARAQLVKIDRATSVATVRLTMAPQGMSFVTFRKR